ncbi:hypothetical protein BT96DRAFT_1074737 [Gymnopus androsaceus JB14]|uniref:Oxidase ustYa n=1 Tax=Gymnopus androsaceus JB14 TaxID=1447944 RepID=A0A6A4GR46_9AGAR|nr:hypothetical protein BT96DRAFT_1074737 [Gymnopus androsaceus JB14]
MAIALVNILVVVVLLLDPAGSDYPIKMPLPLFKEVQMTYYESVHYMLNGSQPMDVAEWDTLSLLPEGFGRVRLGPESRTFVLTYYHQLHCLRGIQNSFLDPDDPHRFPSEPEHLHHCFNYLRQTLLCEAADSLEKGDFLKRNFSSERIGDTVVCRDWESMFDAAAKNHQDWKRSSKART